MTFGTETLRTLKEETRLAIQMTTLGAAIGIASQASALRARSAVVPDATSKAFQQMRTRSLMLGGLSEKDSTVHALAAE